MILDIIVIVCIWFGFAMQLLGWMLQDTQFSILPWGFLGVIWLVVCIGLLVYRGKKTRYWDFLDFPSPGKIIDLHVDKINVIPTTLYRTRIEGLLKTRGGTKYYRDPQRAALFSGGHEIRMSKDGINHTLSPNDVVLTQGLKDAGIHNINEMDQLIKTQMITMKKTSDNGGDANLYLLTGTTTPAEKIDVENNPYHKAIYDELAKQYSFVLADGTTVSFYQHNDFQRSLGSSTDMASAIDYVRSDEAAKATRIKKNMGVGMGKIALIVIAVIVVILVILGFATGAFDGFIPA